MPRIYDSANNPINFCTDCFPSEPDAQDEYGDVGDGPDGRGNCFAYEAEHPDYDYEEYTCEKCGKLLTSDDN